MKLCIIDLIINLLDSFRYQFQWLVFFISLSYSLFQRVRFSTHNTQQDCTTISSLDCVTFAETLSRYLSWEVYSLYRHRFNTRRFLFIFRFLCYLRKKKFNWSSRTCCSSPDLWWWHRKAIHFSRPGCTGRIWLGSLCNQFLHPCKRHSRWWALVALFLKQK